ncbi:hypothetical protein BJV82DRAFT_665380 [Fennellomyces sp. T-0311]|nr:hypothetical protein BJV82DRAFT_665380 [Fennellomyces sp. T-0311]
MPPRKEAITHDINGWKENSCFINVLLETLIRVVMPVLPMPTPTGNLQDISACDQFWLNMWKYVNENRYVDASSAGRKFLWSEKFKKGDMQDPTAVLSYILKSNSSTLASAPFLFHLHGKKVTMRHLEVLDSFLGLFELDEAIFKEENLGNPDEASIGDLLNNWIEQGHITTLVPGFSLKKPNIVIHNTISRYPPFLIITDASLSSTFRKEQEYDTNYQTIYDDTIDIRLKMYELCARVISERCDGHHYVINCRIGSSVYKVDNLRKSITGQKKKLDGK